MVRNNAVGFFGKRHELAAPCEGRDAILTDLDGVVYRGAHAVAHAVEILNELAITRTIGYLTNNASRTAEEVAAQLTELGLHAHPDDVVTSAQAAVRLLGNYVPPGSTILVVGGTGLFEELKYAGYVPTRSGADDPVAVIQGFARDVGWEQLAEAAFVLGGATPEERPWIATNTDWTIPLERGIAPGNGTLVSAVHTAAGRLPIVAGKPETPIFTEALARFHATKPLFIGDRLDTDIAGAVRAGIDSALVLTGVDGPKQIIAAPPDSRPTYILNDLRDLTRPYPSTVTDRSGVVTVGKSSVVIDGHDVRILGDGEGSSSGIENIDLLRAAAQAIWNSPISLYGLNVPERLYQ